MLYSSGCWCNWKENLQIIEKFKYKLSISENDLNKSYFGVAEVSVNLLYDSFSDYIVVEDLENLTVLCDSRGKNAGHKDAANSNLTISVRYNALKLPKFEHPVFCDDVNNNIR